MTSKCSWGSNLKYAYAKKSLTRVGYMGMSETKY